MVKLRNTAVAFFVVAICALALSRTPNPIAAPGPLQETKIQGWTMEDRQVFYHTPQGTRFFPYKWLLALEAPLTKDPFLTEERMKRYRLIPDPNTLNNPDALPVGMAKQVSEDGEFVSITCSACHTAQIKFNDTLIRIDGGPAMHSVDRFIVNAYESLAATAANPYKLRRFADKLFAGNSTLSQRVKLRVDMAKSNRRPTADRPDSRQTGRSLPH